MCIKYKLITLQIKCILYNEKKIITNTNLSVMEEDFGTPQVQLFFSVISL